VIIFMIVLFIAVAVKMANQSAHEQADRSDNVIISFAGLRLTPTSLIEGYGPAAKQHSLAGLTARVEDAGTLSQRITATRLVLIGVFALAAQKKNDLRTVYLTVEGPDTALLRAIELKKSPKAGVEAREFAAQLNLFSRQFPSSPPATPQSDPIRQLDVDHRADGGRASVTQSTFSVVLLHRGNRPIQVIKTIRETVPRLSLNEAKGLVYATPRTILAGVTKEDAEAAAVRLQRAGAIVRVD
jgi:ribosomal protein L7/L12